MDTTGYNYNSLKDPTSNSDGSFVKCMRELDFRRDKKKTKLEATENDIQLI